MPSFTISMSARARLVVGAAAALAVFVAAAPVAAEESGAPTDDRVAVQVAESAEAPAGGFRVYIDPETGRYAAPPADAPIATEPLGIDGARGGGVVVGDSPVPGGGQTIDVSGRFLFSMRAALGAEGERVVGCDSAAGDPVGAGE